MERRSFLATAVAAAPGLAGCLTDSGPSGGTPTDDTQDGGSGTGDGTPGDDTPTAGESEPEAGADGDKPSTVGLETVVTGLENPLDVAFPPDSGRTYVAEQRGTIRVLDAEGRPTETLLDLRDTVEAGGEKGLLGIALHPDFGTNRRLFVRYSSPPRAGTPRGYSHTFVLAEFDVQDDGLSVRRESELSVLEIPQPQGNHNAGAIAFGPDGHLFVTVGDGGAGGDQGAGHVDDWYGAVGGGNGQDVTENLLGSILRIDVDDSADGSDYAIPDDNPLVGEPGLDEHYAWGFRNPWRFAFDGTDLYVGDVGQNSYEEVDLVEKGGNYGWNVREGTHCFGADKCPDETPPGVRGGEPLRDPVIEYPQTGADVRGVSVIPGNVYRGSAVPGLQGRFVFGDFRAEGRLFCATPADAGLWPTTVLPIADADADELRQLLSMARHEGDLYVLGNGANGGGLHRLVPAE